MRLEEDLIHIKNVDVGETCEVRDGVLYVSPE